jgi:hypothetical protein
MKSENTERIESLVDIYAIDHFKQSTNIIIVDMMNEGWQYSDVREYLFDRIEENIAAHKRQDAMDEITQICVDKCLAENIQIPGTRDDIVLLAFRKGWVRSANQTHTKSQALTGQN